MSILDTTDFFDIDASIAFRFKGLQEALLSFDSHGLDSIERCVWEEARESEEIPNIGNIIQEHVLRELKTTITCRFMPDNEDLAFYVESKISYFVNGIDTHFYIDNEAVNDEYEINNAIDRLTTQWHADNPVVTP